MSANTYRYQLPKKAIKSDCPNCGPKHRRTLSRYIDTTTGEPLPDGYGPLRPRSNCGYHLSPYHKGPSGKSYAQEVWARNSVGPIPKEWFTIAGRQKYRGIGRQTILTDLIQMEGATLEQAERLVAYIFDQPARAPLLVVPAGKLCTIPDEVLNLSLGHYERNQFAVLLRNHFGTDVADDLLKRFNIGTSGRWPGACVFWYIDERQRVRGGQIKLFDETFHTVKYIFRDGEKRSATTWVHSAYARRCDQQNLLIRRGWPSIWMSRTTFRNRLASSGYLSCRMRHRISPLPLWRHLKQPWSVRLISRILSGWRLVPFRTSTLTGWHRSVTGASSWFPDLSRDGSAFERWNRVANELMGLGFRITVSTYLEENATQPEKDAGLDLADFLLDQGLGAYYEGEFW